ncbi:MAG: tetratricopeptide repeat protein [Candidatus Hodarchaeales archaeon]
MLSLGPDIIARVAFDSWPDPNLRGKECPFFLAFISEQESNSFLENHLNLHIFEYLDILKEKKDNFSSQEIWDKIGDKFSKMVSIIEHEDYNIDLEEDYSISKAIEDLQIAKNAWDRFHDRTQLWKALKAAQRLEHIEDTKAGEGFKLAGHIFYDSRNYQEAKEVFEKASDSFVRIRSYEKAGECIAFAGKCAHNLQDFNSAIELLQAATLWVKKPEIIATINYDMGLVLHVQNRYEEANAAFEKAVKISREIDTLMAAQYSSSYASKLMSQAEIEKKTNPDYALGLIKMSATKREEAARLLISIGGKEKEAANSLILATSAYLTLGNYEKAVELIEKSTKLLIEAQDYILAAKSLFDGARAIKNNTELSIRLLKKATQVIEKISDEKQKYRNLGLIYFEIGKIEKSLSKDIAAFNTFKSSLENLLKSEPSDSILVPVQIQLANYYFLFEDFEEAAHLFIDASKGLSSFQHSEKQVQQYKRTLMNAAISLRRASKSYHNAATILLKNYEENSAVDLYAHSISLLLEWIDLTTPNDKKDVIKTIKERITQLKFKNEFLIQAESRYKVESMIKSLKFALDSINS